MDALRFRTTVERSQLDISREYLIWLSLHWQRHRQKPIKKWLVQNCVEVFILLRGRDHCKFSLGSKHILTVSVQVPVSVCGSVTLKSGNLLDFSRISGGAYQLHVCVCCSCTAQSSSRWKRCNTITCHGLKCSSWRKRWMFCASVVRLLCSHTSSLFI